MSHSKEDKYKLETEEVKVVIPECKTATQGDWKHCVELPLFITKTRLLKYIENCSKHRLWLLVRTAQNLFLAK